jgi:hypothetical protein
MGKIYMHIYEYYSTIKNSGITSFAGKWMELEIIMLSKITQVQRPSTSCFHIFMEPRPKMMIMI